MEEHELRLLRQLLPRHQRLRRLWSEHLELNRLVDELSRKPWLGEQEQQRLKELKLRKLRGRREIEAILRAYKSRADSVEET